MSGLDWLGHVRRVNPLAERLYESQDRDGFLEAAERLLDRVVRRMESSRATYRKLAEPDLSNLMVELLGELVPSKAEAHQNGHVDIIIDHPRGLDHRYIVECKIWGGATWHREGMKQLLHYATGREGRVMCLAFFVRHQRMVFLLARLRRELAEGGEPQVQGDPEDHPFLLDAFVTRHAHASGRLLAVVHLGCHLWDQGGEATAGEDEGDEG